MKLLNTVLRISLILGIMIYFCILFFLINKKSLNLKYSLLWILSGIIMLIISIFPKIMIFITELLGIVDMTNGLFTVIIFCIILILISITSIVSKMNDRNKQLIQKCALLEKRVRELEKNKKL